MTANTYFFLYHRIGKPDFDPYHLSIPGEVFERQLDELKEIGDFFTVSEAMSWKPRLNLSRRPRFCITFDDGYEDNASVAIRILEKKGIPATFFITSRALDADGDDFWWDALGKIVGRSELLGDHLTFWNGTSEQVFHLEKDATGRSVLPAEASNEIVEAFRQMPVKERHHALSSLKSSCKADSLPQVIEKHIDSSQIRKIASSGFFEIGSHTVNHPVLLYLSDDEIEIELLSSRTILESITNRSVSGLAYPHGLPGRDYDKRAVSVARKHYSYACSVFLPPIPLQSQRFEIPRYTVTENDSFQDFESYTRNIWCKPVRRQFPFF